MGNNSWDILRYTVEGRSLWKGSPLSQCHSCHDIGVSTKDAVTMTLRFSGENIERTTTKRRSITALIGVIVSSRLLQHLRAPITID